MGLKKITVKKNKERGVAMVVAVVSGPPQGALLQRRAAEAGEQELEPARRLIRAVGEVPVVDRGDAEHADEVEQHAQPESRPGERHEEGRDDRRDVQEHERDRLQPGVPADGRAREGQ